jgi:hypothetical protein
MESYCCQRSNTTIKRRAGHTLLRDQINSNAERIVKSQPQVIYTLVDPRTDAVHYVGRTCNPKKRYTQHLSATRSKDICTIEKETWTWELRALGLRPRMDIVETVEPPPIRVLERERRWLYHYIQQRAPLTNIEAIAHPHLVKAIRGAPPIMIYKRLSNIIIER